MMRIERKDREMTILGRWIMRGLAVGVAGILALPVSGADQILTWSGFEKDPYPVFPNE
jgi:hypothetical protein